MESSGLKAEALLSSGGKLSKGLAGQVGGGKLPRMVEELLSDMWGGGLEPAHRAESQELVGWWPSLELELVESGQVRGPTALGHFWVTFNDSYHLILN